MTPNAIDLRDGRQESLIILVGASCPFMADLDFALAVSAPILIVIFASTDEPIEDFALMEASCAIAKILQTFPNIRLPDNCPTEPTGQEKQSLGVLVTSAEGCKAILS